MSISELRDKVALSRDDLSATTDAPLSFDGFQICSPQSSSLHANTTSTTGQRPVRDQGRFDGPRGGSEKKQSLNLRAAAHALDLDDVDQRVAQAIAAERHDVNPIIPDILDELLSREREHAKPRLNRIDARAGASGLLGWNPRCSR